MRSRAYRARLLRKVFEVDPLLCARCGSTMRIVAFLTDPRVIDQILAHLARRSPSSARAPPADPAA